MSSSDLSPGARRRSLRLQLDRIRRKIETTQEEIQQLEQHQSCDTPKLFIRHNPALKALRDRLKHLQRVADEIRAKMQG